MVQNTESPLIIPVAIAKTSAKSDDVAAACNQVISMVGGLDHIIKPGQTVLIKANIVAPILHAVTSKEVLISVIRIIEDAGAKAIVGGCPGFEYDSHKTMEILGLDTIKKFTNARILNFDDDDFADVPLDHHRVKRVRVARSAIESDLIINIPKLKRHKLTDVSISIKNCMGLLEKSSRREIHAKGLDEGIAAFYELFHPAMSIVDGITVPISGAVYGDYFNLGIVAASTDMLALDTTLCSFIGQDPLKVKHLVMAGKYSQPKPVVLGYNENQAVIKATNRKIRLKVYRHLFASIYALDHYLSRYRNDSLIPWFHKNFGIHPVIHWKLCDLCEACTLVCPVNAIDLKSRRLDYTKCSKIRCMFCVDACPRGAIIPKNLFKT